VRAAGQLAEGADRKTREPTVAFEPVGFNTEDYEVRHGHPPPTHPIWQRKAHTMEYLLEVDEYGTWSLHRKLLRVASLPDGSSYQ